MGDLAGTPGVDAGSTGVVGTGGSERLKAFYFEVCDFRPTNASLLHLPDLPDTL